MVYVPDASYSAVNETATVKVAVVLEFTISAAYASYCSVVGPFV